MDITDQSLELAFKGFQSRYNTAFDGAKIYHDKIAMEVPSTTREETYGWLGAFPQLREWLGERIVHRLDSHGFAIKNRKFENTVSVGRDDFEDDRYGIYGPMFDEMGRLARQHPDTLLYDLLARGFTEPCYDGQSFFDTDHPVVDADGVDQSVSNMQAGAEVPWFLIDTSRALKPMIWQVRSKYDFQRVTQDSDSRVFMTDEFFYGTRARVNAGFGLWQLAFASKDTLDATNYAAARATMMGLKSDNGRPLGIVPDLLVVPPSLEEAARALLKTANNAAGAGNPWSETADLIVCPYLA